VKTCVPDSSGKICINCGVPWRSAGRFGLRNCLSGVKLLSDFLLAAEKLGITGALQYVMPQMAQYLAVWKLRGYPERTEEEVDRLWHAPCEHRSVGGLCGKIGCRKQKENHVACLWLSRMATASCPAAKFTAEKIARPVATLPAVPNV